MKKYGRVLIIKERIEDELALQELSRELDLTKSETARRALRVGMKVLRRADFPGRSEKAIEK